MPTSRISLQPTPRPAHRAPSSEPAALPTPGPWPAVASHRPAHLRPSPLRVALLALCFGTLLPTTAPAQAAASSETPASTRADATVEADALFRELVPFGSLEAKLDGKTLDDAQIFLGERAGAYLLLSDTLGKPLLINIRARQIEALELAKVRTNDDGTVDLSADTQFDTVGPFRVKGSELRFALADGRKIVLGPKPSLIGLHPASSLLEHNPAYAFGADRYPPDEDLITALRARERDVTVRVYFGSWCSTCTRVLPWILRVDRELDGSKIDFEYYGLPRTMDDPIAQKIGLDAVPTAIVIVDGQEVGRSTVPDLGVPEKAIATLLENAAPSP